MQKSYILIMTASILVFPNIYSQDYIDITSEKREILTGKTEIIGDRNAFTGSVLLKDVQLKNGTIE